ncbi:MAG TPA: cytochrome c oxidase subunit II [Solirubrobacteraceae bacterium]
MGHLASTTLAFFTPQSGGSPNANEIDSLYKIVLWVALVLFFAVTGALLYAMFRYRARRGAVAAQIRGNTRLEVGWTVGAALILIALAVVTFVKLPAIQNPPNSDANAAVVHADSGGALLASATRKLPPNGKALQIHVIGRQYVWQYVYPGASEPDGLGAPYSYEELVVPVGTTVLLDVEAVDVVHEWWVPALGPKVQAVPGYHNYTWFKALKPGIYRGQCSFICGRGHARMIATVKAVSPSQFEAWLSTRKQEIAEANKAAQQARETLSKQTGAGQVENP